MNANLVTRCMKSLKRLAASLLVALAPSAAYAQQTPSAPADGLSPTLGWQSRYEDNVYQSASDPTPDVVSILSATTGIRRRLPRVGLTGSASGEWMHYATLERERGANVGADLKVDFLLNRLTPYVSTFYQNSKRRLNREIDALPRIEQSTLSAGSVVRVGAKTSLDLSAGHTIVKYGTDVLNDGVSLDDALNRASDNLILSLAQEITPLTRVTVTSEMRRDRFNVSSRRSADYLRFTAGYESDGTIRGRAQIGMRVFKPHDATIPESRGLFVAVGTGVSIRDRVQLTIDADRDLAPSYRPDIAYYESYGYGVGLSLAMVRSLRLTAMADRRLADYQIAGMPLAATLDGGVERQSGFGAGVSYLLGTSMQFSLSGIYTERTSFFSTRDFDGLSVRAGVTHAF
jgi:hypothetical protein